MAKTKASIWNLALFPLHGRKDSSDLRPALCAYITASLIVNKSKSSPSRLKALTLAN